MKNNIKPFKGSVESVIGNTLVLRSFDDDSLHVAHLDSPFDGLGLYVTRPIATATVNDEDDEEVDSICSLEDITGKSPEELFHSQDSDSEYHVIADFISKQFSMSKELAAEAITNGQVVVNDEIRHVPTSYVKTGDKVAYRIKGYREVKVMPLTFAVARVLGRIGSESGMMQKGYASKIKDLIVDGYVEVNGRQETCVDRIVDIDRETVRVAENVFLSLVNPAVTDRKDETLVSLVDAILRSYPEIETAAQAKYLIEQGWVFVDGAKIHRPLAEVRETAIITLDQMGLVMIKNPENFHYYNNLRHAETSRTGIRKVHLLKAVCDMVGCYAQEAEQIVAAGLVKLNGEVVKDPLVVVEPGKSKVTVSAPSADAE